MAGTRRRGDSYFASAGFALFADGCLFRSRAASRRPDRRRGHFRPHCCARSGPYRSACPGARYGHCWRPPIPPKHFSNRSCTRCHNLTEEVQEQSPGLLAFPTFAPLCAGPKIQVCDLPLVLLSLQAKPAQIELPGVFQHLRPVPWRSLAGPGFSRLKALTPVAAVLH